MQAIKRKRRQDTDERQKVQEVKERQLVSATITNTANAIKLCGSICKSAENVDELVQRKHESGDSAIRDALLCQIKYYKSINRGLVKGSLFYVTSGGKVIFNNRTYKQTERKYLKNRQPSS